MEGNDTINSKKSRSRSASPTVPQTLPQTTKIIYPPPGVTFDAEDVNFYLRLGAIGENANNRRCYDDNDSCTVAVIMMMVMKTEVRRRRRRWRRRRRRKRKRRRIRRRRKILVKIVIVVSFHSHKGDGVVDWDDGVVDWDDVVICCSASVWNWFDGSERIPSGAADRRRTTLFPLFWSFKHRRRRPSHHLHFLPDVLSLQVT